MAFTDLLSQTGTITNRTDGDPDSFGVPVKVPADPFSTPCYLEPLEETEQLVGAETYVTKWRLFLPADTAIDAMALFTDSSSVVYQVIEVLPFINPRTDEPHHIECKLEQVKG